MPGVVDSLIFKAVLKFTGDAIAANAAALALTSKTAAIVAALSVNAVLTRVKLKNLAKGDDVDLKRDVVIRSATEAKKIVYGKALVGGVLAYSNVAGNDNANLFMVIAHAGHECSDITEMWLDDTQVVAADIPWGGSPVTGGDYFIDGVGKVAFTKYLGTSTQIADSTLVSTFPDWTNDHRGRGICYTVAQLVLDEASQKVFESGAPGKVRALITGKKVYNPDLDTGDDGDDMITNGFSSTTFKVWSDNPVLCLIDYLLDPNLGFGIDPSKIDWTTVSDEAAYCEGQVFDGDGNKMARFTCNGVLSTFDDHKTNINRLLSSCNGSIYYKNGKWGIRVGRYGTGPLLINDGTFSSIGAWTNGDAARGTVVASGGVMLVTNTGGGGFARGVRAVPTTVGWRYSITSNVHDLAGGGEALLGVSNNSDGSSPFESASDNQSQKHLAIEFTATASTTYIVCQCNVATTSASAEFDDVEPYLVTNKTITADFLRDALGYQSSIRKEEKFNTAKGFFDNPEEQYKNTQALQVVNAALKSSRDGGKERSREFRLPMTNSEYGAQLLLFKRILMNGLMHSLNAPCQYLAIDTAVHDRVLVSIDELGYTEDKVFKVEKSTLVGADGGVDLLLREDNVGAYLDPDQNDYSTRTATGSITLATPSVPAPTNATLTAVADLPHMKLSCTLPEPHDYWDFIEVWRNTVNNSGTATRIYRGRAADFEDATTVQGTNYYYWYRATKGNEESAFVPTTPTNANAAHILVKLGTNVYDEDSALVTNLRGLNQKITQKGFPALNLNAYIDIALPDNTPANYYIGRQTGSADRDDLITFEDNTHEVMVINSGSARPMILTAAMRLNPKMQYFVAPRWKADVATTVNIHVFLSDSANLGDGIVTFCTSPSGEDPEVGTATRENGNALGSFPASVDTAYGLGSTNIAFQWQALDGGTDISTPYDDAKWISFGIQRDSGAADTDIYIDALVVWGIEKTFVGSGAP